MNKVLQDKKAICFFVLPALLVYLTILVYPMITSIVYTFFEGTPNVNMKFVGLTNYKKLFSDREFLNSIIVTGKYFLVTAAGWVILGLLTALMLAYGIRSKRGVDIARTVIYTPVILPGVAVAIMWRKILEITPNYGLLNSLLSLIGAENYVQAWIGQSSTAIWCVAFTALWAGFGYYTILFYAGWLNVPKELEESAKIDGCNTLQTIRHIALPIMKPVTVMCIVLSVMYSLRVYDLPSVMTNGGPGRSTQVLSFYMYKVAFENWKYGYGSTLAVVILLLSMFCTQMLSLLDRDNRQ
jgi:raffinose/stachyose/melibiose transport system permease protein